MDDYSALFILSYFFSAPLIQVTKACFDFVAHLAKGLLNSVFFGNFKHERKQTTTQHCIFAFAT